MVHILVLLRPIAEIPRLHTLLFIASGSREPEHFGDIPAGSGQGFGEQRVEESIDNSLVAGHPVIEGKSSVGIEAKQSGLEPSQLDHTPDYRRIGLNRSGIVRHIHFLAQSADGTVFHKRPVARSREVEKPAIKLLVRSRLGSSVAKELRQALQILFVRQIEREGIGRIENVLAKLEGEQ